MSIYRPENPLIVQADRTVLLEVNNPRYEAARDALAAFAELERSPEHVHTYRITPLSLWNAAAAGHGGEAILDSLREFSKYDLPGNLVADVAEYVARYGRLRLLRDGEQLVLESEDRLLITELQHSRQITPYIIAPLTEQRLLVRADRRGHLKQALVEIGYPAQDLAGYVAGTPLALALRDPTRGGRAFGLRDYQQAAVDAFWAGGSADGGSGTIVLPCGAGKTMVGLGATIAAQAQTLILCFGTTAVRQWIAELLDKTTLSPNDIGEYTGDLKEVRPVTVTTYQILTYHRRRKGGANDGGLEYPHLDLFNQREWGLIVYDEVHLLPAPVFRVTAEIQARRRLGLTATLVREDGREKDVFSLIGPKKFDLGWRLLEQHGWIAQADCWEIRVALPPERRLAYAVADDGHDKYRLAASNPDKLAVLRRLLAMHADDNVLIIGQYLDQIEGIAHEIDAPLITGKLANRQRERLYEDFRIGRTKRLVVSKVANFAIDLPEANVAIQVSGTFGSRQEEAQRLGRVLRPKADGGKAHFYALVTRDTNDQDFAAKRQLFLTEQGYRYTIMDATTLLERVAEVGADG
ncbi:MAG: DEAD/DEAH box helicase [Chloroflexi bacterium]|nr:DEAD/DEAH box helicase [Chloroflexota bacterium]